MKEGETTNGDPKEGSYTPERGSRGGLIIDKRTVNVFLIALLSAITATTIPFHTRWVAERYATEFRKNVRYVAETDGRLRTKIGQSSDLIEVKPRERETDVAIRIQETA